MVVRGLPKFRISREMQIWLPGTRKYCKLIAETLRNSEDSRARVSNRFCPWRADVDLRARGGVKGAAVSLRRPHEVDPGERRVGLAEGDEGPGASQPVDRQKNEYLPPASLPPPSQFQKDVPSPTSKCRKKYLSTRKNSSRLKYAIFQMDFRS